MKIPGITGSNESDEEKLKRHLQEKAAIQDSVSTGKLEQQAVLNSEESKKSSNELLNPESDKQRIKQLLLNVEPVQVQPRIIICQNCNAQYDSKPGECGNCGGKNQFKIRKGEPEIRWRNKGGSQLINTEGFNKIVWSEIESAINVSVSGGYLSSDQIGKLNYSTLATITSQLALYWYKFGVGNPSDMQQIGDIIRHPLLANTSKARGGRGLKNQESTRIEKFARTLTGEEQEDEKQGLIF